MARDTEVQFKGENVPAQELEFEAEKEPWSIFRLEDGSVLRMRQVLISIARLTNEYKPDGEPIYIFNAAGLVHVDVPQALKKKQDQQP